MVLNNEMIYCTSALRKLGFSRGEIAILVLGIDLLLVTPSYYVPNSIKDLIKKFIEEQEKVEKTTDPFDRKVHKIQTELLYIIIKKQLDDYIKIFEEAEAFTKQVFGKSVLGYHIDTT